MAARSIPIQTIRVRGIASTMTCAYVRVQDAAVHQPVCVSKSGRLSFKADDDTEDTVIVSYRNERQALIDMGRVPSVGDQVSAEGELWVGPAYRSMALRVPRRLGLDRATVVGYQVGGLSARHVYQKVLLRGQVRKARAPY
jgi:hypothetical protein